MIVQHIDIGRVAILDSEYDAPFPIDRNAPISDIVALQRMQSSAGQIQVSWLAGTTQTRQHALDFLDMLRVQFAPVVIFIEAPQATVTEAPDHSSSL